MIHWLLQVYCESENNIVKTYIFIWVYLFIFPRCSSFQDYRQQFWRNRSVNAPLTYKYPNYKPEVFAQLLNYIYTGKVNNKLLLNMCMPATCIMYFCSEGFAHWVLVKNIKP